MPNEQFDLVALRLENSLTCEHTVIQNKKLLLYLYVIFRTMPIVTAEQLGVKLPKELLDAVLVVPFLGESKELSAKNLNRFKEDLYLVFDSLVSHPQTIVFFMHEIEQITAAGLVSLYTLHDKAKEYDDTVVLANMQDVVSHAIASVRFTDLFDQQQFPLNEVTS